MEESMAKRSQILIASLILAASWVAALEVSAATAHAAGPIEMPPFDGSTQGSVEVVPLTSISTEHVTLAFRMEVQHMGSADDRMSTLVLHRAHQVTAGDSPFLRMDVAFFDAEGNLLGTFEYGETSAQSFDLDDPTSYPTSNVMEAATMWELPPEVFDAVNSYQIVIITR
jgi:hypothetical protein